MAAVNAVAKEYYDDQKVRDLVYKKNPAFALVPKNEEVGGKYYPVPTQYEVNQGRSSTFSNAQGNQTSNQYAEFLVVPKADYDIATVANQTLKSLRTDKQGFLKATTTLMDGAIRGVTLSASSSLFRTGTGTIGQVSGSVSSGVITLTNPADVVQFAVGQTLQANATDGGTPRAALGYVIARSLRNGTVTVSATAQGGAAGTPTSWSASDYLLVQGDNNLKFSGFSAWLPMTDPTSSDNFYGVNRSTDYRLYGIQYDGSGQPIEEAVVDHTMLLFREGADTSHFFTNTGSGSALKKALGSRVEYENLEGPAHVSFRAIVIEGAGGPVKMLVDRNCQVRTGYMLQLDSWELISLGAVPEVLKYEDRLTMLRVYNADSAEFRCAYYANLCTPAPGWNGQLQLSS